MATFYIWIKAIHVVFMVTWFAGLFYLPRLFIYHVQAADDLSRDRFNIMERRLFAIMTIGAALTTLLGITLLSLNTALLSIGWFQAKLFFIVMMFIYHYRCWCWIQRLAATSATMDTKWLRWFNEIPVLFLLAIVILVVVKPV